MASIENSYIYKSFNASNGLIDKIVKYIKTSIALDKSYIEDQYTQIRKTMVSPLSRQVLEAYDKGDIELLYSRETKVGISVPFIIRSSNATGTPKPVATIFISSFAVVDKDDQLSIPVKQLYALMETAYIGLKLQVEPFKFKRNAELMRITMNVYSQMIMRILNKEYAITLDKVLYDKVTFATNKFFLANIWEYQNTGIIDSYASSGLSYIDNFELSLVKQGYDDSNIKDISDLIKFISTLSPRMSELNIRYFIEKYINTFHGSSIMSIDYLPYVFFVICNVLLGSFLISQTALSDIIKNTKSMNKFYIELGKSM